MTTLRLFRVILPVRDLDRTVQFYSKLFETPGERVSPGRHYFNCGSVILACYSPTADGDELSTGWRIHENQYLYFAAPDLEAIYARIELAGGTLLTPIEHMPWGERIFYALDPEGSRISFVDERTLFMGTTRLDSQ